MKVFIIFRINANEKILLYKFQLLLRSIIPETKLCVVANRVRRVSGRINELRHGLSLTFITTWITTVNSNPFKWQNNNFDSTEWKNCSSNQYTRKGYYFFPAHKTVLITLFSRCETSTEDTERSNVVCVYSEGVTLSLYLSVPDRP